MADSERQLVSTTQAAKAVGLSQPTLSRWYRRGKLRPAQVTPGGHVRWDLDDLRRQLDRLAASGER